ncbi:hypothetical protein K438DRAFT_2055958 [Mycena galopus ATCC 62051]|nr:hypothetical protein K438DRAFT_2055958 [Mycena galopus ATCC 62051]
MAKHDGKKAYGEARIITLQERLYQSLVVKARIIEREGIIVPFPAWLSLISGAAKLGPFNSHHKKRHLYEEIKIMWWDPNRRTLGVGTPWGNWCIPNCAPSSKRLVHLWLNVKPIAMQCKQKRRPSHHYLHIFLELDTLLAYKMVEPWVNKNMAMAHKEPPTLTCIGAFASDPVVTHQLFTAGLVRIGSVDGSQLRAKKARRTIGQENNKKKIGITTIRCTMRIVRSKQQTPTGLLFWFLRPTYVFDQENILGLVDIT